MALGDKKDHGILVGTGNEVLVPQERDSINHPSHYNIGIETIDYIESWGMDFNQGNLIKYATRFNHKKTPLEDLKKAMWYLKRLIEIEGKKHD